MMKRPIDQEVILKIPAKPIKPTPMSQQSDVPLATMLPYADDNIFCLVRLAMIRAMAIHEGSKPMIDTDPLDKATSIALQEIAQGKVSYKNGT